MRSFIRHRTKLRTELVVILFLVGLTPLDSSDAQQMQEASPGDSANQSVEPPVGAADSADKKCCACIYRERTDTQCESLDAQTCKTYRDESNPNYSWICLPTPDGKCKNYFKANCESALAQRNCDRQQMIPHIAPGAPIGSVEIPWPNDCTEKVVVTQEHGAPSLCSGYFEFLQDMVDASPGTCRDFYIDTDACSLFADTDEVIKRSKELCLAYGITCTISANQCKTLVDPARYCPFDAHGTRFTVCITGDGTTTYTYPKCPPLFSGPECTGENPPENCKCFSKHFGETQVCVAEGQTEPEKRTCCARRRIFGSPPDFGSWIEGESCPTRGGRKRF